MQSLKIIPPVLLFCLSSLFANPAVSEPNTVKMRYRITASRCTEIPDQNSSYRVSLLWTVVGTIERVENFNSNINCQGESDSELTYNPNLIELLTTAE